MGFVTQSLRQLTLASLVAWTSVAAQSRSATPSAPTIPSTARAAFSGYEVVHESWSTADGLPVNSINQLVQTRDGYIWAATFDGLVRFDGARFSVFNSANSAGLPSDRIVRLDEGAPNVLWMVTEQRHIVRWRDGRFTVIAPPGVTAPDFRPILAEANGTTWIATARGLARVNGDTLVSVLPAEIRDTVITMARLRDGTLLVGLASQGIARVRLLPDGRAVRQVAPGDSALVGTRIASIHEDGAGTLWLGGLSAIFTGRTSWSRLSYAPGRFYYPARIVEDPRSDGVLVYGTRGILPGEPPFDQFNPRLIARWDGRRWSTLATGRAVSPPEPLWMSGRTLWYGNDGVIYRDEQPIFSLSATDKASKEALEVTTGLTDREGSVWIGTFAAGLHRLKPTLLHTVSVPEGLRDRNVYPTLVDRSGAVWAGSWSRGIARIDPVSGRVDTFGAEAGWPPTVRSILEGRDGTLWLAGGGTGRGLYRCPGDWRGPCTAEPIEYEGPLDFSALFEDADARLWLGTHAGLLRRDNGIIARLDPARTGAPRAPVRAFATTPDGAIWMGTNGGGVVRYREGVFTAVTTADGLPGDVIRSLHVDADGWLWIGTEGRGLARLDPRGWSSRSADGTRRRIASITSREGLFDNVIHQILEDESARLWMNTNRGIFWITRAEAMAVADGTAPRVHSTGYTERDGMRNREGNGGMQPAGAVGRDGRLWFPTQDGVVVIDPRSITRDTLPPPVVVEQVVVGDSVLLASPAGVRLSPAQRAFRIEYTALTYLAPRNVRFRYRLDGYDDDWVDADTRRNAFYSKLPPGRYTFRVQATTSGSDWYEPGAQLTLIADPLFYETFGFRSTAVLALIGVLVAAARRRIRDARQRARELEAMVVDRTATLRDREQQLEVQNHQLEEQAGMLRDLDRTRSRFFANVSHELRTPLTLMIAPLDRLRAEMPVTDARHVWLDLAQRNARRLLELVQQILDVAKLEAGAMRLTPRRLDLGGLLRSAVESFRLAADRKSLDVQTIGLEPCDVVLDRDAMEKIVTNLLSNAVKFTPIGGTITIALQRAPASITLTVANTGPVVPPEQLALVFERFYQVDESQTTAQPGTGIGLSLVKELVELQQGTVIATSTAEATTFTVRLPLGEALAATGSEVPVGGAPTVNAEADEVDGIHEADVGLDVPTILVVDDSEDMRTFVRLNFDDRYRVLEAANGAEGLEIARTQLPDVVISDVMMPVLDGRAMVQALRASAETDFLAIVLLTAQADDEQRLSGLEGGADDYLVKPFEMRELDVRVRNLIAARSRLRVRYHASATTGDALTAVMRTSGSHAQPIDLSSTSADPTMLSADDRAYRDRIFLTIRAKLGDPDFGVAELASAVFQDRSHLFRRVRQVTGVSPSELLRRLRAEEGARLLRDTSGSVADVAFTVGFRSVSHFYRCFQEHYAMTPAAYRATATAPLG